MLSSEETTINGQINLSSDIYSASGIEPRHPSFVSRAIIRSTVTIEDIIQLPFELYITTNQIGFQQPFNQFGISPKVGKWLQVHGGYFSKKLSNLTFGDLRILGGALDLSPGDFRASFLYGLGRIARSPDSMVAFQGEYSRSIAAAKLGYGDEQESFVHLNIVRSIDDSTSLQRREGFILPEPMANTVASISTGLVYNSLLKFNGEASVSATTRSLKVQNIESEILPSIPNWILPTNSTTSLDKAFKVSANLSPTTSFSIQSMVQWIGPGYITSGFPQLQNDVFEWTVSPSLRLFSNSLFLKPSIGIRKNNVLDNRFSTTTRTVGSFVGAWQPSQNFSLNSSYTNFGMSSEHRNDTLFVRNVFSHFSLNPRITFRISDVASTVGALISLQDVEDKNSILQFTTRTTVKVVSLYHSLFFPSSLSFNTNLSFNSVITSLVNTKIFSVQEKVSKTFFNQKFLTSFQFGINYLETTTSDLQMVSIMQLSYDFGSNFGKLSVNNSFNSFASQDKTIRPTFNELQSTLQYSISF